MEHEEIKSKTIRSTFIEHGLILNGILLLLAVGSYLVAVVIISFNTK